MLLIHIRGGGGKHDLDSIIIIGCTDIAVSFHDDRVLDSLHILKDLIIAKSDVKNQECYKRLKKDKDMTNKQALDFFKDLAANNSSQQSVKLGGKSDFSALDVEFLLRFRILNENYDVLELGAGTGLLTNKIYDKVKSISALEMFEEFSRHIIKDSKIRVINENIFDFVTESKFDVILAFGFMHYVNESEAKIIYQKCFDMMKQDSILVVKNQFGISQDVTIEEFSKEQNREYFSQYRLLSKEMQILKNIDFKDIQAIDIYPKECNRWDNTHFYAIVAKK